MAISFNSITTNPLGAVASLANAVTGGDSLDTKLYLGLAFTKAAQGDAVGSIATATQALKTSNVHTKNLMPAVLYLVMGNNRSLAVDVLSYAFQMDQEFEKAEMVKHLKTVDAVASAILKMF